MLEQNLLPDGQPQATRPVYAGFFACPLCRAVVTGWDIVNVDAIAALAASMSATDVMIAHMVFAIQMDMLMVRIKTAYPFASAGIDGSASMSPLLACKRLMLNIISAIILVSIGMAVVAVAARAM